LKIREKERRENMLSTEEKTKRALELYDFIYDHLYISNRDFDKKYPDYGKYLSLDHNHDVMDYIMYKYVKDDK